MLNSFSTSHSRFYKRQFVLSCVFWTQLFVADCINLMYNEHGTNFKLLTMCFLCRRIHQSIEAAPYYYTLLCFVLVFFVLPTVATDIKWALGFPPLLIQTKTGHTYAHMAMYEGRGRTTQTNTQGPTYFSCPSQRAQGSSVAPTIQTPPSEGHWCVLIATVQKGQKQSLAVLSADILFPKYPDTYNGLICVYSRRDPTVCVKTTLT